MTTWDEVVASAREELARMERCPDACGHTICALGDRAVKPGTVYVFDGTVAKGHLVAVIENTEAAGDE